MSSELQTYNLSDYYITIYTLGYFDKDHIQGTYVINYDGSISKSRMIELIDDYSRDSFEYTFSYDKPAGRIQSYNKFKIFFADQCLRLKSDLVTNYYVNIYKRNSTRDMLNSIPDAIYSINPNVMSEDIMKDLLTQYFEPFDEYYKFCESDEPDEAFVYSISHETPDGNVGLYTDLQIFLSEQIFRCY